MTISTNTSMPLPDYPPSPGRGPRTAGAAAPDRSFLRDEERSNRFNPAPASLTPPSSVQPAPLGPAKTQDPAGRADHRSNAHNPLAADRVADLTDEQRREAWQIMVGIRSSADKTAWYADPRTR